MFRDKVIAEAVAQRELRKEGRAIPAALRRYARLAGLGTAAAAGGGATLIVVLAFRYGTLYWGGVLFLGVLGLMGLVQAITGLHLITRR